MKYLGVLLLLLFFISSIKAQEAFVFEHGDCVTRVRKTDNFLYEDFLELMQKRGYSPKEIVDNAPLYEGEIYMEYKEERPRDKFFRDCVVQVSLKQAKKSGGSTDDEILYQHQIKRSLPRFSFSGKERCRRAIKDAFVHIPVCKKP